MMYNYVYTFNGVISKTHCCMCIHRGKTSCIFVCLADWLAFLQNFGILSNLSVTVNVRLWIQVHVICLNF